MRSDAVSVVASALTSCQGLSMLTLSFGHRMRSITAASLLPVRLVLSEGTMTTQILTMNASAADRSDTAVYSMSKHASSNRARIAAAPPVRVWHGHGTTSRVSPIGVSKNGLALVDLEIRYESDFWFSVAPDGRVTGTAVVHYHMSLDDSRLRGIAAYVNGTTASVAGGLSPILGTVLSGASVKDIVGMRADYDGSDPVRTGRITGALQGGTLHLAWAEEPSRLPYTVARIYLKRDEVQSTNSGPAYPPWVHDATVTEWAPGHWQAVVPDAQVITVRDQARTSSTWHAEHDGPPT